MVIVIVIMVTINAIVAMTGAIAAAPSPSDHVAREVALMQAEQLGLSDLTKHGPVALPGAHNIFPFGKI
jgi:hypothetical protein